MKKKYEVIPFISVGNINFGISKENVEENIGKPNKIIDNPIMGEVSVYYPDFILIFIRKRLVDVRFTDELNMDNLSIIVKEVDILETKNLINILSEMPRAKPSKEIKGYINFYNLGLNLAGFGRKKMKNKREIRFFSKGRKNIMSHIC
ncbi:hypothetical protein [Maribacter sp. Asnod2-G09]|uniref:hypothetical protein n=1 Tax=Maribacter sp. Asnod2-G09 TaxID=3160577 RepID=UPI00386B02EA